MLPNRDLHVEITGRATFNAHLALTGETDTITGIHTRWYLDGQCFLFLDATGSVTLLTRIFDDLAGTATGRTRLLHREKALLHPYLAHAITGTTSFRPRTLLGPGAVAGVALSMAGNADLNGFAFYRLFQIQL